MKIIFINIIVFLLLTSVNARDEKYFVEISISNYKASSNNDFVVISAGAKFQVVKVASSHFKNEIVNIIEYPQVATIRYYKNCNDKNIKQLKDNGISDMQFKEQSFFTTRGTTKFNISNDSILLIAPNVLQKRYLSIENAYNERVFNFNENIGKELYQEQRNTSSIHVRDSIRALSDHIFKTNVAQVNMDSIYMPAIISNLKNDISIYTMGKYIWIANVLGISIPKRQLEYYLNKMPLSQKNGNAQWKILKNELNALNISSLLNHDAPEFTNLKDSYGKVINLKNFKGQIVLIDFWASWCIPCRAQIPALKDLYNNYQSKGLAIIAISLDENILELQAALEKEKVAWINITDLKGFNGKTAIDYKITTVPHNYLLNKEGQIVAENLSVDELNQKIGDLVK